MSKSLLEELLIQAGTLNEETEKRVNTNQKTIIESTMANAVKNFIQEAVEVSEGELDGMEEEMFEMNVSEDQKARAEDIFEEEDIDAETGEAVEGEDEEIDVEIEDDEDMEGMEDDEEIEIEDDEDMEGMEDDEEIEIEDDEDMEDEDMYDEESDEDDEYMDDTTDFEDEEEVLDMTNASLEEVMDFIENSEDEVVVKIVKKPTYSVSVENMDDDTEIEVNEDMLAEVISKELEEVEKMNVDVYSQGEDISKAKGPIGIESPDGNVKMVTAENRKLKNQLAQLKEENRNLKLNETKSVAALKTMMEQSKKLALVNSNLAYVSRLFTEHVTTKQEKVEILKAFDSAKTINESQKRFKVLNESLSTRTQKKKINVNIKESVDFNQQKVIKEEKAFVEDPAQASILRLMNYKSQL
jgi:hypothetical protein